MIEPLHVLWGGAIRRGMRKLHSHRLMHERRVNCLRAEEVLRCLLPYLVTKRAQAELGLEFREKAWRRPDLGPEHMERMKSLKRPSTEDQIASE